MRHNKSYDSLSLHKSKTKPKKNKFTSNQKKTNKKQMSGLRPSFDRASSSKNLFLFERNCPLLRGEPNRTLTFSYHIDHRDQMWISRVGDFS